MSEEQHTEDNGWDEYKKLVLSEIQTSGENYKELYVLIDKNYKETISIKFQVLEMIGTVREEIAALKVKASIWGICGGIGAIIVALGIFVAQQALAAPH